MRRRGEVRGDEEGREPRMAVNTAWGMRRLPAMNSRTRKASAAASGGMAAMAMRNDEWVQAGGLGLGMAVDDDKRASVIGPNVVFAAQ